MATYEIDGKDDELKLTYKAIKYLNGKFEGGSYELIGNAIQGDIVSFPLIVHAGLFNTGKDYTLKSVEERVEELIDNGELTLEGISKITDEGITKRFFYKATVDKMMKNNPEMKKALEQLRG